MSINASYCLVGWRSLHPRGGLIMSQKKLFSGVMRAHSWMHAYDNQWNPVDTVYSTPMRYDAIQGASLVRVTLWDPLCFNSISNYYSHNSKRAHPNIHNNKVSAPRFSSSQGVGTPSSVVWALSLLPVHVTSGEFRKSTLFRDNVASPQVHFFLDFFYL